MSTVRIALVLIPLPLLLGPLPGCRKESPPPVARHVQGTPHTDQALSAFRAAGLSPEGFVALRPAPEPAVFCERGRVKGVDTTICEYQDDVGLDRGVQQAKAGWARADVHTGVVVRAKYTLLTLADRERREPSGKTIRQMVKIFRELR
jgi:hypothetical protein